MALEGKTVLFSLIVILSLFFLYLAGETLLGLFVMTLLLAGLLGMIPRLLDVSRPPPRLFTVPMVFFLFSLVLSGVFTISIPATLHSIVFFVLSASVFMLFLSLKKEYARFQNLSLSLVLVSFYMVVASALVYFFPEVRNVFSGMNLLYPTFGHNHLVAVLLLTFPLAWWWYAHRPSLVRLVLVLTLAGAAAASFGRLGTGLMAAQMLVLGAGYILNARRDKTSAQAVLLGMIFLGVLGLQTALSVLPSHATCIVPSLAGKLCKSVEGEARPWYWKQTRAVWLHSPWVGGGPGTFALNAPRFQTTPYVRTAFSHNAFLQIFAETGLIGGISFLWFMGVVFFRAYTVVRADFAKPEITWKKAVFLGAAASGINALFDFDWSFVGVFIVTLILLAFLLYSADRPPASVRAQRRFIRQFRILLAAGVLAGAVSVYLGFLYRQFEAGKLSPQAEKQLAVWYTSDPEFFLILLQRADEEKERQQLQYRIADLDPWKHFEYDTIGSRIQNKDWQEAARTLEIMAGLVSTAEHTLDQKMDYDQKHRLAHQGVTVANALYATGEYQRAGRMMRLAYTLDEWALSDTAPDFISGDISEYSSDFFWELRDIDPQFFGFYREAYAQGYLTALQASANNSRPFEVLESLRVVLSLAPWLHWSAERNVLAPLLNATDTQLAVGDTLRAQQTLDQLWAAWQFFMQQGFATTFDQDQHLARNLERLGGAENLQKSQDIMLFYELKTEEK